MIQAADHFSASYSQARERLLEAAHHLSPRMPVMVDSRSIVQKGPAGETLALDWIQIGARRPKRVVVISSGTHGTEGPVGSAVQLAVARLVAPSLRLEQDCALVLQHANNPWGYAWSRRVNADNVDLNRNFLDHFPVGFCDPGYEALYDVINPANLDDQAQAARQAKLAAYGAEHGERALQASLTSGQYKHAGGVQFGGFQMQPEVQHLRALTREHLASARDVAWIDLHTGLGESGACELISGFTPDSAPYQRAKQIWNDVRSATAGESLSAPLSGVMDLGLATELSPGAQFAFVFPEFGTYPVEHVMHTLIQNNWLWQHGDPLAELAQPMHARIRETFSPASAIWQQTVLERGLEIVDLALDAVLSR
jgi:hypothetical protein